MSDHVHPYTVSAVVNTTTGELVSPPQVRDGHEDYDAFSTAEPLAATEQFRWVHVWAPDRMAAAATDALTGDLRPGGDRTRPLARALDGDTALKPYTVAAVVRSRTNRPIADPVVIGGHHDLSGAAYAARWGTRSATAQVWALDQADAINQVFGSHRPGARTARDGRAPAAVTPPSDVARLSFATPPATVPDTAGAPSQPAPLASSHRPATRPHSR